MNDDAILKEVDELLGTYSDVSDVEVQEVVMSIVEQTVVNAISGALDSIDVYDVILNSEFETRPVLRELAHKIIKLPSFKTAIMDYLR